ncbi:T9SS type A sorting domain-containing protein [Christiangramia sediminis]|uniref:T9SS type A sorting domain-containing protein n=1 Tax=Christiangramia sediminis TaxID=2881336 RepID=A0A9X1LGU9_9FLAO|nr:T9SS type A sorting domain-containing protein [Christiangramia sediminis]MCB7480120.1 T9SS type A sorting domain-containing protein [Christiangramia sediminis]
MKKNFPRFFKFLKLALLVVGLCFFQFSFAQDIVSTEDGNWHEVVWNPAGLPEATDDVQLSHSITIERDSVVQINNLNIGQTGEIIVLGTLVVNGNINMDNNGSYFGMGDSARVIIFGDFIASNKVDVSISSYLIIHGSFNKSGSEGQGSLDVENGNIYIYGDVDGWPNFGDCDEEESYSGTPEESGTCDYGSEDDLANNPDIPDELLELNNCYDLSNISNQIVCEGASATFSIPEINGVNYQWQLKFQNNDWTPVGTDSNTFTINNTTLSDTGNIYRVIVKPVNPDNTNCKISISRKVSLNVQKAGIWTGNDDTNWNNNANWSCNYIPTFETSVTIPDSLTSNNYPVISSGTNAFSKDLVIEDYASIKVDGNWLRIAGSLTNAGVLNTETGSVSFEGTSAQIIPNSAFENNRIQNLQINNISGVISETTIEITGTLKVQAGNFDTGNDLTLISDENQTALIDGSGNGEVIGLVNMQRYLDKAFGYKYFSSPFQNSVVGDFAPYMDFQDPVTAFPHFYRYDENRNVSINDIVRDATGWEPYIETENSLNTAEGYALNFGASSGSQTIELIGEVNNGNIPARQLENNHLEYTKGFHLVGNPYPSPINWNAAQGWTRNNIDDGIYFFTASENSQYTGKYTAYVNDISTGNPQADGRSSNIIPSMQGFFIKVSDSDTQNKETGSFGMDNRVRVTDFEQEFLRTQLTHQKALIRLEAAFNKAELKDPMVIYFSSFATPNFEKEMDAHKLMNTDPAVPSFYNITEDQKELAINAISYPDNADYKKIPLGIKAEKSGVMKINLASLENISPNLNIYLIDHNKGIGQNLRKKPEYTFNIEAGTHNSRFELMFSEEKVANPAVAFNELFHVGVRNGDVIVKLNLENNQQGILRASTMTGQLLQTKPGGSQDEVIFDRITSDGVYIINLQLGKGQYAKKVIIKK